MNFKGTADFKTEELAKEWSALASALFEKPFGSQERKSLRKVIKKLLEMEMQQSDIVYSDEDKAIVVKIKELINTYVRPAVERWMEVI
ncbi:unnamed protein product [Bathycoccus prasinos]